MLYTGIPSEKKGRVLCDLATDLDMKLNTFLQNIGRARRLMAECLLRHGVTREELTP